MKPTQAAHTPLPWSWRPDNKDFVIESANLDMPIACVTVSYSSDDLEETDETQGNAAFIVRAVNAHEELIMLTNELMEVVKDAYSPLGESLKTLIYRAEQAIAKAEGRAE